MDPCGLTPHPHVDDEDENLAFTRESLSFLDLNGLRPLETYLTSNRDDEIITLVYPPFDSKSYSHEEIELEPTSHEVQTSISNLYVPYSVARATALRHSATNGKCHSTSNGSMKVDYSPPQSLFSVYNGGVEVQDFSDFSFPRVNNPIEADVTPPLLDKVDPTRELVSTGESSDYSNGLEHRGSSDDGSDEYELYELHTRQLMEASSRMMVSERESRRSESEQPNRGRTDGPHDGPQRRRKRAAGPDLEKW